MRTLTPIVSTLVIIFLLRIFLAYSIYGVGLLGTISTEEEGTLRFLANIQRVVYHQSAFQLLLFGAGAIVWLPLSFRYIGNQLKLMLLFSIPPFMMLMWAGNFVELRIYNEFVPLLAVLFSQTVIQVFNNGGQASPVASSLFTSQPPQPKGDASVVAMLVAERRDSR